MCVLVFVLCLSSAQSEFMAFFIGFKLWVCPDFIFSVFNLRLDVLTATSMLLPSDKICSQVHIITILLTYCTQ